MPTRSTQDPAELPPMHLLEFQTLLVLMEGDLHGYGIAKAIESRENGLSKILPTNLYRRLRDMAEKGLISEAEEANEGGRKLFHITRVGREVAQADAWRLEAVVRSARGQD